MAFGRILGWFFIAAAIAALGVEVVRYFHDGTYQVLKSGRLWFDVHRGSLQSVQNYIELHLDERFWDAFVAPALQLPAWALFGIPGILLVLLSFLRAPRPSACPS